MKKNANQIDQAEGQRATIRSTEAKSPSQAHLDLLHERRLRMIEARDVRNDRIPHRT
ncbi:hypothetical protein [Caballeronia sp. INDeC2]|uniref:hypothetical protein n=1 Tax=Caballeronia sp. INDeC2 TaxID=2921747 RepID=UPI002028F631|nr:hypothetical protein [Caballeronia sp. INDeC2]